MSYEKSMNPMNQEKLRVLSFSPDENFDQRLKIQKNQSSYIASNNLYKVYHNNEGMKNVERNNRSRISRRTGQKGSPNPESSDGFYKTKFIQQPKATLEKNKIRAKSSHEINLKKYYMSINLPQAPHNNTSCTVSNQKTPSSLSQNPYLSNTLSPYKTYTSSKQAFYNLSKQRIQEQKDLTFLSRTFTNIKKSEEKTKQQLVDSFKKRMERESRERQKIETKRKQDEWLEQQKNQNNTRKYMNHLLKYHAKKSLIQNNTECAQQMRSRLKSQQSVKSQRSLIISQQKKHRAYLMKVEKEQNLQNAKVRIISRINEKSNSMKNDMAKVYQCQKELEAWRIEKIDERSRFMLATIQNSKKNKEVLQKVLDGAKNMDSNALYEALAKNLAQTQTQRKGNHK